MWCAKCQWERLGEEDVTLTQTLALTLTLTPEPQTPILSDRKMNSRNSSSSRGLLASLIAAGCWVHAAGLQGPLHHAAVTVLHGMCVCGCV